MNSRKIGFVVAWVLMAASPAFAQKPADCTLPKADRSVIGIKLGDEESAIRVIGRDTRTVIEPQGSDLAWTLFASRGNRQLLALRHHPGDVEFSYREFEVKLGRHDRKPAILPVFDFATEGGIRLGMKRRQVVARMGSCFKTLANDKSEVIRYEISESAGKLNHPLLKAANMPQYYAEYEFRSGTLVRFRFGHDPV
jgi:hypothetical protein